MTDIADGFYFTPYSLFPFFFVQSDHYNNYRPKYPPALLLLRVCCTGLQASACEEADYAQQ
jgi:hypothetical protein